VSERNNPEVKWRTANQRDGSPCDNIVSRNLPRPHAHSLDESFFLSILAD
jgi:hypothetical protein